MKNVVTLTMNPCVDKSTSIDHVVPERKLRCSASRYEPGGGGVNVSRAIYKLGEKSVAVYPAGQATGQMLQALLNQEGIMNEPIRIEGKTRESFMVYETNTGQQYRFGMPGPNLSESEQRQCLEMVFEKLPAADFLILSGSLPPEVPDDFYARIVKRARDTRSKIIVDCTGNPLRLALQERVFLIKPNLRELNMLSDSEADSEDQMEALAQGFVDDGLTEIVVVSLGAAGAFLVWGQGHKRLRAPTVSIQSKVGAGDSMVGGIVSGLVREYPIEDAVRFGVAAGAAAVMTPGTELCRKEDTERLYKRMRDEISR